MGGAQELDAFARTVRRLRRERDLSQRALAAVADLAEKHVSEIERGNREPKLTTIFKLARGLGVPPESLIGETAVQLEALVSGRGR
ncbi:MAG TPA: helix-turn-helix transcriptional regulator [Conexibacter sp.]|nr:helix-turn-helix transcriptional regulator [Conexibacter sp.]